MPKQRVLSGMRPTGKLHLGNLAGALENWKKKPPDINRRPTVFLLYAMGRTESGEVKRAISLYFTELKRLRTFLSGKDLKKMGFPPGPLYHEILQALLRERLDGRIQTAAGEAAFVRKKYGAAIAGVRVAGEGLRL